MYSLVAAQQPKEISSYAIHLASKKSTTDYQQHSTKPKLADFVSYNEFLQAMYLYQKNQEQAFKPDMLISLPSKAKSMPESSSIDSEKDITVGGEDMPTQQD